MDDKDKKSIYDITLFWWKTFKNGIPNDEGIEDWLQAVEDEAKKYRDNEVLKEFFTSQQHVFMRAYDRLVVTK